MRAMAAAVAVMVVLGAAQATAAQQGSALGRYEARAIVTGTDMRSRPRGLAACLIDVLVKVSGDPSVAEDPRALALAPRAIEATSGFDYWDRMSGIPTHDEQGSYDRPYNLTARFPPAFIDAALRDLGRAPWPDPRPELAVFIRVRTLSGEFELTAAEPRAAGMWAALADSGERYGMRVVVPDAQAFAAGPQEPSPARAPVSGRLELTETSHGWIGEWRMEWDGRRYEWGLRGVNFDEAFRQLVRGAMRALSGHGAPG